MRSTLAFIMGSIIVGTACADGTDSPRVTAPSSASRSTEILGSGAFQFTPLDASAVCTVSGGNPNAPFLIPSGYTQSIVASEPAFAHAPDMNTVNETGPQAGRFLYRPSEGSVGQVTVTDLVTGQTKLLAARSDWEGMDPIVWTPWGTLLVGEETNVQQRPDPDFPNAVGGLMYEIFLHQGDPTVADSVVARPALGAKAHEGTRFDSQGNVYGISERNPGYIFKFVPDHPGSLATGQLYALEIVSATGDRTGDAEWLPLDRASVQIDANAVAQSAGATGYNRPEDVEIATSSGNSRGGADRLFVAVTGQSGPADNRVLAIDLHAPDAGPTHSKATVFDYVRIGLNAPVDFEMPDNLALDRAGNLYIAEDPGGSFATKHKGDDIWVATPPSFGVLGPATSIVRFATLTDCDAEPTGIYFGLHGDTLFVNAQHRGGDHLDKAVAISRNR